MRWKSSRVAPAVFAGAAALLAVPPVASAATLDWSAQIYDGYFAYLATATGTFYVPDETPAGLVAVELQDFSVTSSSGAFPLSTGPDIRDVSSVDPRIDGVFVGLSNPVFYWNGEDIIGPSQNETGLSFTDDFGGTWTFFGQYPYAGGFYVGVTGYTNLGYLPGTLDGSLTMPGGQSQGSGGPGGPGGPGGGGDPVPEPMATGLVALAAGALYLRRARSS